MQVTLRSSELAIDFCSSPYTKHSRPAAFANIPRRELSHAV